MEQKDLEMNNTEKDIFQTTEDKMISSPDIVKDRGKVDSDEKGETSSNISSVQKAVDFRQTAKYSDTESYAAQHHHSIGEGLYLTEDIRDLPPRFRDKVVRALENAFAVNNIPMDRDPIEYLTPFSTDSKVDDKNRDKLVYLPPNVLNQKESESKADYKSSLQHTRDARKSFDPHFSNSSPTSRNFMKQNLPVSDVNSPKDQTLSNSLTKNKIHAKPELHVSGNYCGTNFDNNQNKNRNREFRPKNFPRNCQSQNYSSGTNIGTSQLPPKSQSKEHNPVLNVNRSLKSNTKKDSKCEKLHFINVPVNTASERIISNSEAKQVFEKTETVGCDTHMSIDFKSETNSNKNTFPSSKIHDKGYIRKRTSSNNSNYSVKSQTKHSPINFPSASRNISNVKSPELGQVECKVLDIVPSMAGDFECNVETFYNFKDLPNSSKYRTKSTNSTNSVKSQTKHKAINSSFASKNKSSVKTPESLSKREHEVIDIVPSTASDPECCEGLVDTFYNHQKLSKSSNYSGKGNLLLNERKLSKEFSHRKETNVDSSRRLKCESSKNCSYNKPLSYASRNTFLSPEKVERNTENNLPKNTVIHNKSRKLYGSRSSVISAESSKSFGSQDSRQKEASNSFSGSKHVKNVDYSNINDSFCNKQPICKFERGSDCDEKGRNKYHQTHQNRESSYASSDKFARSSHTKYHGHRNNSYSNSEWDENFSGRCSNEWNRQKNYPSSKVSYKDQEVSKRNDSCSSNQVSHNFIKNDKFSSQSSFDKKSNKLDFRKPVAAKASITEMENSYKNRGCYEVGFFVKIEVSEKVRELDYWMNFFCSIFPFEIELERCCHFSDILVLEFEWKEDASQGLYILQHQKKKHDSKMPHFLQISSILKHITKPCNCKNKIISDCVISIEKHFTSSVGIIDNKIEEIKSSNTASTKYSQSTMTTESEMLKTFEICKLNFTQIKEEIEAEVKKADDLKTIQKIKYSFIRECNYFSRCLPIYSKKNDLLHVARYFSVSVVVAETGSGKSTQLVQYLLHSNISEHGLIICTQPRKLAAISIAQFVSGQIGSSIGKIVGYDVGIERKCSESTKIIYMTDYCLLKQFLKNRQLKGVSCIIIDEAHERSLYTDLILGLLKQCLNVRKDLSIVITSATINPTVFINYFKMSDKCVVEVPGRSYPVDVVWLSDDIEIGWDYLDACVQQVYEIHVRKKEGDILVFLTSPGEAEEAIYLFKRLLSSKDRRPQLFCLHGKTDIQEQMQIFQNTIKNSRKIVFATNVAETAVTIPGIKYVVDSGMTKELMFDPKNNKSYLSVTFITKSAAEQRRGRAGRTQSGICYRMYSKRNYAKNMADNATPEILKTNLQKAVLKIFELGIDPENFDFIEAPSKRTISNSVESLEHLGAIENKKLTEFGKKIAKLPLEPQLSKFVLLGIEANIGYEAIVIASLVSESGKLFIRNEDNRAVADEKKRKFCHVGGDLCTYLEIFKKWKNIQIQDRFQWCVENYVSFKALNGAAKAVQEIVLTLRIELKMKISINYSEEFMNQYEKIIFDSFSENLCILSGHSKLGYLSPYLPESFFIHPSSTLSYLGKDLPEFLVYSTLMETSRNFLFDITPISEATLKFANQTGKFKLPLHSLKCLQVPPKVMGPFGESVLIRHILGKQGAKIKDIEKKIKGFTNVKNMYLDVAVDKGLITVYISRKFHEKVEHHIKEIIQKAQTDILEEEDVIKLTGTSLSFALSAGGIINDIIMPGEFRELLFHLAQNTDKDKLENVLEKYGSLQDVHHVSSKKELQICATYKKVCDAQKAFFDLREKKYNISSKPCLPNVNDKTLPLYILHVSWCISPCTGFGSVEFFSEEDLIVASSILTSNSFYLGNNLLIFSPSAECSRELKIKCLPRFVEEDSIKSKLVEHLPDIIEVKTINIFRETVKVTKAREEEAKEKLSKLFSLYVSTSDFVINIKPSTTSWNAKVYFENAKDAENIFMKLKDSACIDSYPLFIRQIFKASFNCKKEIYNMVSKKVEDILKSKENKGLCDNYSVSFSNSIYNVNVEFSCSSLEELNKTRQSLRQFLQGESLEFIGMTKYHFLFSDGHIEQIKAIQNSTNTVISLQKARKVITIYGLPNNCRKAKEEIYHFVSNPDYSCTRTFNMRNSCIPKGFLKQLYVVYGYDLHGLVDEFKLIAASIDNFGHTLTLTGLKHGIKKAEQKLERLCEKLFKSNGERAKSSSDEEICPICLDPVSYDFQRLEHCGHAFCRQCLLLQLESKILPLVCAKQNCGKLIVLEDIKRIISFGGDHLKKAFCSTALQHHVSCNVGKLSYCPTPDCEMIYRLSTQGSEYQCPACKNSTCTHCQSPFHYGMSCDMFRKCQNDEDYSLKAWMKENEEARKYCPSCKAVIEKIDGCNHMECLNCKVHLCWLCLQIFPTGDEVYKHMPYCPKNQ